MESHEPIWKMGPISPSQRFPGGKLRVDTAVIGAGLTGLSSAYHLLKAQPGQKLLVLEAQQVGAGASSRSTGMLTPGIGQNLAALVSRVGHDKARAMYDKTLWAIEYVAQLCKELDIDCELQKSGQFIIAKGPRGGARLAKLANVYADLGLPHEALSQHALDEMVHLEHTGQAQKGPAAIRLPVAGSLHPGLLLNGLLNKVQSMGGIIYEKARVLDISAGQPATISLDGGGQVVADEVVLATSGYTPELGVFRGRVLPVHLSILLTEPLSSDAMELIGWKGRECIIDSRRLFNYFRLTKNNQIIFGGGLPRYHWRGSTNDDTRTIDRNSLATELANTFPVQANIRVERNWSGVIGYVLDAMPVIQRLGNKPAVTHVGGWCGHGIPLSVASGAWVAHMLSRGEPPEELPWFRSNPPKLPFESVRWLGFKATTGIMALMDRV